MYSPLFPKISETPRFVRVVYNEDRTDTLPEPFHHLSLRKPEAPKPPVQQTPFEIARFYNGSPPSPQPFVVTEAPRKLAIKIEAAELGPVVKSIEEAEEMVFAVGAEPNMTFYPPDPKRGSPTFIGDVYAALAIQINRCANLIAARTRRGAGNKVFMHPKVLAWLIEGTASAFKERNFSSVEKIGLWTLVGKLNNCIDVYVGDHFPEDRVTVVYIGSEMDAPAQLVTVGDNTHIVMMENSTNALGNAVDYVCSVAIAPEGQ